MRRQLQAVAMLVVAALAMGGCGVIPQGDSTQLAALLNALKNDEATFCKHLHVIYGIGNGSDTIYRTNIKNGTVKCDDSGMNVTSNAPSTLPPGQGAVNALPAPSVLPK